MTVVPHMKYSSRFFLYAPLGVFVLLLGAAGIHWWILASRLGGWLDAHNGREAMPGVTMAFDSRRITGFPFSLDTEFKNVRFTVATPSGPTEWRSERFAAHALTYGREETIFEAAGHQTLAWLHADGTPRHLDFAVGSLRASAIDKDGALTRFDLDVVGFGSTAFTAQRLQVHLRHATSDSLDYLVSADALVAAAGTCPALGTKPANLTMQGTMTQARAFAGLLAGAQDWSGAVADWRRKGGEVTRSGRRFNPLELDLMRLNVEELPAVMPLATNACGFVLY